MWKVAPSSFRAESGSLVFWKEDKRQGIPCQRRGRREALVPEGTHQSQSRNAVGRTLVSPESVCYAGRCTEVQVLCKGVQAGLPWGRWGVPCGRNYQGWRPNAFTAGHRGLHSISKNQGGEVGGGGGGGNEQEPGDSCWGRESSGDQQNARNKMSSSPTSKKCTLNNWPTTPQRTAAAKGPTRGRRALWRLGISEMNIEGENSERLSICAKATELSKESF